jgi:hypothetical protein
MRCPEYLRLRQHYEAALRHWGRVILSTDANVVGKLGRQAFEIKETAFADRNAAKKRLDDHSLLARPVTQSCGGFPEALSKRWAEMGCSRAILEACDLVRPWRPPYVMHSELLPPGKDPT